MLQSFHAISLENLNVTSNQIGIMQRLNRNCFREQHNTRRTQQ